MLNDWKSCFAMILLLMLVSVVIHAAPNPTQVITDYPVVNIDIKGNKVILTHQSFYTKPKSDTGKQTPVPNLLSVTWTTGENPNFDTQNVTNWLKGKSLELDIPNADKTWVIFSIQQMGYYRVNYDEESWRRIFTVLDSESFSTIHEINRAMIVGDLFNLARAGQLKYDIVFEGIRYLRRETAFAPWKAAKVGFTYLAQRFAGHSTMYESYRTYVLDLLKPISEKLKFSDKDDDTHIDKLLRKLVLDWMCSLDSAECIEKAKDLFDQQRRNSSYRIPSNQKDFAYCTTIKHGKQEDWDYLKLKYEESYYATEKITILNALGCSQNSTNLKSLLNDVIKEDFSMRLQDAQKVFSYVIKGGHIGIITTLKFVQENHQKMRKYFGDDGVTKSVITTISKQLSTEKHLEEFKKFIEYGQENIPTISKSLQTSLNNAVSEIKWFNDNSLKILKLLDMININYRLPKTVKPLDYDIYLTPYFEERNFTFDGYTSININFIESDSRIIINTHNLNIINVISNDFVIESYKINDTMQQLFIYSKKEIPAGTNATLTFEYTGVLRHDMRGFYKSHYIEEGKTKWIASTQFQPTYARSAFPCFDEPSFKAKFKINIAKPKGYHTLSNMGSNATKVKHASIPDRTWDKYPETPLMSSYLIAFVVSDFVSEKANNSTVAVWSRKELQYYCNYASTAGGAALEFLGKKLAQKYSMPEINFVSIPDFDMGAMENWGLVTFREYGLSYDVQKISATYRRFVNTVISHELVHMWFGNLVTLEWWDFTWLNEGFADYLSYLVSHDNEKTWELLKQFVVNSLHIALDFDASESAHPMNNNVLKPTDIQNAFDKIAYQKAASVLRMLHISFGEENFFEVLQNYIKNNKYANTRPEDLVYEFQNHYKISNKSVIGEPEVSITDIMKSWVDQAGYPIVSVQRIDNRLIFRQKRFLVLSKNESARERFYWTPITYTTESEQNFKNMEPKFWLGNNKKEVFLKPEDSWFVVNIQEAGFYRVNYDPDNWRKLSEVLSKNYTIINELNRAQLIDDSLNLARAGNIRYELALNITKYLSQETNYFSWKAFFNAVTYLSQRIDGRPDIKNLFTKHILTLISKAYDKYGFEDNVTDAHLDQLTRELILTNACKYGHKDCVEKAIAHFKNDSVTPNIAAATYCTAIEHGDKNDWRVLWNKFVSSILASDYITILKGLGCSKYPDILEKYLDLALERNSKIRRQDFLTVVSSIYTSSEVGLETALKYFKNHVEELHAYYGNWDKVGALFTGLAGLISKKEQLENLKESVSDQKLSKIKSSLESAVKTAEKNLEWFDDYSERIRDWFEDEYGNTSTTTSRTTSPTTKNVTNNTITRFYGAANFTV